MSHRPSSLRSFLSCTCLSLTIALPALCVSQGHAQNALQNDLGGSNGNALDNNLKMNSAGQRMRGNTANTQRNYGLGNLGVTGGLAGGRNFRLDDEARQLGLEDSYLGVNDFRGQLGSDDIFNELQGSALSQIEFVTSGLANQSYLNASGLGMFEYRKPKVLTASLREIRSIRIESDWIACSRPMVPPISTTRRSLQIPSDSCRWRAKMETRFRSSSNRTICRVSIEGR